MQDLLRRQGIGYSTLNPQRTQVFPWSASTTTRDVRWPALRTIPVSVSATGRDADWRVENIDTVELGAQRVRVAVDPAGVHHGLRIRLPGRYNVAELPAGGRAA